MPILWFSKKLHFNVCVYSERTSAAIRAPSLNPWMKASFSNTVSSSFLRSPQSANCSFCFSVRVSRRTSSHFTDATNAFSCSEPFLISTFWTTRLSNHRSSRVDMVISHPFHTLSLFHSFRFQNADRGWTRQRTLLLGQLRAARRRPLWKIHKHPCSSPAAAVPSLHHWIIKDPEEPLTGFQDQQAFRADGCVRIIAFLSWSWYHASYQRNTIPHSFWKVQKFFLFPLDYLWKMRTIKVGNFLLRLWRCFYAEYCLYR